MQFIRAKYICAATLLATAAQQSQAANINLTDTVTYLGGAPVVTAGVGTTNGIAPTVSFGISNAFNGAPIGSDFAPSVVGTGGPWNFYDDYVFSVGAGANVQSALISFSSGIVGISNLQARIVAVNPPFDPLANLLGPASGNTIVDAWTTTSQAGNLFTVSLNQTAFGAGTYALQIRGEVGASASGSYGGSISFTPVPLPAALPLLISGLGLLGIGRRNKGRSASAA